MKTFFRYIFLVGTIVALAEVADAVPTLKIGIGSITTVADGDLADLSSAVNEVSWSAANMGGWNITVDLGVVGGSQATPELSLQFVATPLSSSSGALTFYFSADGFGPTPNSSFSTSIDGSTSVDGTVIYRSYFSPSNTLFDTSAATLLTSGGPFSGSFSDTINSGLRSSEGLYSLSEIVRITNPGNGQMVSGTLLLVDPVSVPDGGTTALLLGFGLVGLSVLARKFKAGKA